MQLTRGQHLYSSILWIITADRGRGVSIVTFLKAKPTWIVHNTNKKHIMSDTKRDETTPEEIRSSDEIEILEDEEVAHVSEPTKEVHTPTTNSKSKKAKKNNGQKRKGQMSIADFKGIHVVKAKENGVSSTSTSNNSIKSKYLLGSPSTGDKINEQPSKTRPNTAYQASSSEDSPEDLIPKKHRAFNELESDRYKVLKTEKTKKHPSLKSLQSLSWTPNVPLRNRDFQHFDETIHDAWFKDIDMQQRPFASYIMKIMSFINKFDALFDKALRSISFKDMWEGLSMDIQDGPSTESQERMDNINLLLHSLMRLLFWEGSTTTGFIPAEMSKFKKMKQPYGKMVGKLWSSEKEWGSPKEWRTEFALENKVDESTEPDRSLLVDPAVQEILTDTSDVLPLHIPIDKEENPFYSCPRATIDEFGVFAMPEFKDRVILLHYLVDLNLACSPIIRRDVNELSNVKHDQLFTYVVPNFLRDGIDQTLEDFADLCESIMIYINSKRNMKQNKYKQQIPVLDKIRGALNSVGKNETQRRQEVILSMFKKWCTLLDSTIPSNSLLDPYSGDVERLRQQEFFVGRIDAIGDFFVPRMHTYENSNEITNLYTDLLSLLDIFDRYTKNEINDYEIFGEFEGKIDTKFSLLYRDTPINVKSTVNGEFDTKTNSWYELCEDSKSLQTFIDKLSDIISGKSELAMSDLLKDNTYHHTKTELSNLHNYLTKLYPVIVTYEKVKQRYLKGDSGTDIATRTSRAKRTRVNYKLPSEVTFDSDDDIGDAFHQRDNANTGSTSDDDFTYDDKDNEDTPDDSVDLPETNDGYAPKANNSRAMRSRLRMERK